MAVQDGHGKIATNGLIFGYDVKDTVNSYLGEPTQNLATDSLSLGGWPGSATLIDSTTKTFDCVTSSIEWGGEAAWTTFYYDVSQYTGQYVTISAIVESVDESNGTFNFIWIGQTIEGQTYLGYSPEADRNFKGTKTRERISWSGVIGSGGKVGILIWMNNGAGGQSGSVRVRFSNVQVELKSHPTAFVNGTRSITNSLIDLTKTKTISLANASFDSDSSIILDGTDDYISGGPSTSYLPLQYHSLEACIKSPGLGPGMNTCGIFGITYGLIVQVFASGEISYYAYSTDGGTQVLLFALNSTNINLLDNNWHHIVCTRDSSNVNIYIDGVLNRTTGNGGNWSGTNVWSSMNLLIGNNPNNIYYHFNGSIGVSKIYNRALTAGEVLQNFKTYRTKYGIS